MAMQVHIVRMTRVPCHACSVRRSPFGFEERLPFVFLREIAYCVCCIDAPTAGDWYEDDALSQGIDFATFQKSVCLSSFTAIQYQIKKYPRNKKGKMARWTCS